MLPGFRATMETLTSVVACLPMPAGPLGEAGFIGPTRLLHAGSLCLSRLNFQPFRLQSPQRHFATIASSRYFTVVACRVYPPGGPSPVGRMAVARSRVRQLIADSPTGLAESSSCSYGLVVHLGLLSTFPFGNAVTVGYRLVTLA